MSLKVTKPAGDVEPTRASWRTLNCARLLVVLISLAMLGLLVRVVQLQLRPSPPLAALIDSQQSRFAEYARRGNIVDRVGRELASSRVVTRLFADPSLIDDPRTFAQIVADTLGYDPRVIQTLIEQRRQRRYVALDHDVNEQQLAELARLKVHGLGTQQWVTRHYPQGELLGQIIGFTGAEGQGLEGLERAFDAELSGADGSLTVVRNVRNRAIAISPAGYAPPRDGQVVRVSIDLVIQAIAEEELAAACRQYAAPQGQLVVMDPHTGHILAMANYPAFNPAGRRGGKPEAWRNRAVTDQFEPGSIFKPFVWAFAVDRGSVRPAERIDTTEGGLKVFPSGRRLRDTRGHGSINVEDILVVSSNIGMAEIAMRMGDRMLHESVQAFGFAAAPGSGLPGEAAGTLHPVRKWSKYSITSIPMGQEVAVTPLQAMTAFCALASDGSMPQATIRADQPLEARRFVVSTDAAALTRRVLRRVVTEGTGRKANSDLYALFGKTGTAQVAGKGGYLPNQYVGSFIGGAPYDNPQLVVGCFIHRPDKGKGYYGGIIAAPVVRNVTERTLTYLGVAPTPSDESQPVRSLVDLRD